MRKHLKTVLVMGSILCMTLGSAMTSQAGTWRTGAEPNQVKWWYDYDNGSYAENGWQWIDGNKDGLAECYYFDTAGWMLADTKTPDGYTVNADGAWVENGAVQTRAEQNHDAQNQNTQSQNTQSQAAHGAYFAGNYDGAGNWVTDLAMMDSDLFGDFWGFFIAKNSEELNSLATAEKIELWAQETARGAYWKSAIDTYGIPYKTLLSQIGSTSGSSGTITLTTTVGIPADALRDVEAVIQMVVNIRTDGMGSCTFSTTQGASGQPATVTINYKMMG